MNKLIVLYFLLFHWSNTKAQNTSFAQKLEVESSFSYYWETKEAYNSNENFGLTNLKTYDELSFSTSFNMNITNRFHIGLRAYIVRGRSQISPMFVSWHHLIGPALKYNLIKQSRFELNFEADYLFGDYCPNCLQNNEYYNTKLQYIGLIFDVSFQPFKSISQLWFKFSFAANKALNASELNGYNIPLLGLQYRFGKSE